jgi:hypothetical protein
MQTDWAFWNVGDDGLTGKVPENPPFLFGSGKSGTPCDRMHLANVSFLARFADPEFADPPGRRPWHACRADWYCGEFWSTLVPEKLNPTDPFCTVGSGKFGSPCDRMQFAYASACAAAPDAAAEGEADADGDDASATPGPSGPLEHPAISTHTPVSAIASRPALRPLRRIAAAFHGIAGITHSLTRNGTITRPLQPRITSHIGPPVTPR